MHPALVIVLSQPIVGSSVIKLIISGKQKKPVLTNTQWLRQTVKAVFPNIGMDRVQAFVQQVSAGQTTEYIVKTKKERVNITHVCPS